MKILVIGDSCTDIFRYGKVERIAPEAPIPIIVPEKETSNPGMAGNVRRNIESIFGKVDIHTNSNWYELTKTRYVHQETNHMFFRIDSTQKVESADISKIDFDYDAIVISDYNKGFIKDEVIAYVSSSWEAFAYNEMNKNTSTTIYLFINLTF